MAGAPLRYALQAAESVVDQLEPSDILSLVVYDDKVDTIIPPQAVTDKTALKKAIRRVRAGGLTNLSGGWLKGCEYVKGQLDSQKINRVLLLTDGLANVGIRDPQVLTTTASKKAVLIPSIAVAVRRLHDTGRSGWWLLIGFIPFIGVIVLLVFMLSGSQPGKNQYD